jgi:hypothetical protein
MALSNFVKRLQDKMRNDAGINGDAQGWTVKTGEVNKVEQA